MRAVSNTSPLSNLASIGRLHLLRSQFTEVLIPQAVVRELSAHPDPQALGLIQTAMREQWIKPAAVSDSPLLKLLLLQLHRGEAEAIALASEMQADMVLIDEQEGRQLATQASLSVTGVLGVLLRAKHYRPDHSHQARDRRVAEQGSVLYFGFPRSEGPEGHRRVTPRLQQQRSEYFCGAWRLALAPQTDGGRSA